jgi:TIR domain
MSPSVFVSYQRCDSAHVSGRLRDRLIAAFGDGNVFFDVDSIPSGADFPAVIRSAIAQADVLVIMIGPGFAADRLNNPGDFVRLELAEALRQSKAIVPVLVDTAQMPAPDILPDSLRKLAYINASVIRRDPDFHRDAERLIATLRHKGSESTRTAGSVDSGRIPSQSNPPATMLATSAGAPGNPAYPGMTKLLVCRALSGGWRDVADVLDIPSHERARFSHGYEAQDMWDWLSDRQRLGELRGALRVLGRDDLVRTLDGE